MLRNYEALLAHVDELMVVHAANEDAVDELEDLRAELESIRDAHVELFAKLKA